MGVGMGADVGVGADVGMDVAVGADVVMGADRRAYGTWMARALELASRAAEAGDVPVGALVVGPRSGSGARHTPYQDAGLANGRYEDAGYEVMGEGWNTREATGDPTGHAEVMAVRAAAARRGSWRLDDCTLFVTLEPCCMCAGAASLARMRRIVLGAWDPKAGACGSVWDLVRDPAAVHRVEVIGGVLAQECAAQLRRFFEGLR